MKKYLLTILLITFLLPYISSAQVKDTVSPTQQPQEQIQTQPASPVIGQSQMPRSITSGFYFKIGPVFPLGNYASGQILHDTDPKDDPIYFPAKMGAAIDMGFLIYFGPAFANNHLRVGLDATFFSFNFNSIKSDTTAGPKTKYWYYYGGQKFGPVISICPVDKLIIDLSYKLNAYVAYLHHIVRGKYNDEWGMNLFQNEFSMNIRYSIMLFSFQYNYGQTLYNDFDGLKPNHYVDNDTFRFLVGVKF
ncbi:MAG: hypothetical protein NTW10_14785 [Bacteroidetes bacterium]|nr:hypothetical protein [Bacteroidota bacterium]